MKEQLQRLRGDLGKSGLAALVLIGLALAANLFVAAPMRERAAELEAQASRAAQSSPAATPGAGKLESLYSYLARSEAPTDWLAKLYGIAQATGVQLDSGTYRQQAPSDKGGSGRISRYEIVLPVQGAYPQLRDFLTRTLAEIPVLSLDQVSLKRESRSDGDVQAELKLTLHLVKP